MPSNHAILVAGDLHGSRDHLLPAVRAHRPGALILLGDLEAPTALSAWMAPIEAQGTRVWFIPGNHDTDHAETWAALEAWPERNLHGRVVDLEGVRVAGLGGVFRSAIWHPLAAHPCERFHSFEDYLVQQQRRTPPAERAAVTASGRVRQHRSSIFPDVYEALASQRADVLVTHEAPSCHPHGLAAIDRLARSLGVHTVLHGHHHDCLDYAPAFATQGFRAYGVGLRGVSTTDGTVLIEGKLDAQRRARS